ncbi:hypothetical protein [Silvimonas sp.]|uniref:hypothetical protein n=1 Tax=Silvimonas sp. TaxID=2650811 RepID=UPI0028402E5A|nr:hypothetical protein [Silvimonas sp.]MDR3427844.1 hypothetical protein [Silvimonas sp.]
MKTKLYRAILLALNQCDGVPMPEAALFSAASLLCRPDEPTPGEIADAIQDLATAGHIDGTTDDLVKTRVWLLTAKGILKARALR